MEKMLFLKLIEKKSGYSVKISLKYLHFNGEHMIFFKKEKILMKQSKFILHWWILIKFNSLFS
jgi:hypothetical protein